MSQTEASTRSGSRRAGASAQVSWRASQQAFAGVLPPGDSPQSVLARQLADAWNGPRRLTAQELLTSLTDKLEPEAAVRVIFEEICLRQEDGEEVPSNEYLDHFPQYRSELVRLFECQELIEERPVRFPESGETFAEFTLEKELGRGAQGRVFLATQRDLAHRQLVLKFSPCRGEEHLSLARVQHTNIAPIYFAREEPARNLRVFAMPYLGGATLSQLLQALAKTPVPQRSGADLATLLRKSIPVAGQTEVWASRLAEMDYVSAILTFGIALAEALEYVHRRGLAHLDLKPSNVLITAEGQPMLLDFHLAREPVTPSGPRPEWFGGTPEYMPPEQRRALDAIRNHTPIPETVDGRADLYSLGLVLYEALAGEAVSIEKGPLGPLEEKHPYISPGLSDIVARAMQADPARRYPTAAALAEDLRRQRDHFPLAGVPNRSLGERWRKWRRRRPSALAMGALLGLVLATAVASGGIAWQYYAGQRAFAETALVDGRRLAAEGRLVEGAERLAQGLVAARAIPGGGGLAPALEAAHADLRARQLLDRLHNLVEHLRFLYSQDRLAPHVVRELEAACRELWQVRDAAMAVTVSPEAKAAARTDLADLAVLWADLAGRATKDGHARAVAILDESRAAWGENPVLARERAIHAREAGLPHAPINDTAVRESLKTAWEHYALGRSLMRENRLDLAQEHLARAVELAPQNFWANFYQAECAYRLDEYAEALSALKVCVALAPQKAECYYNRGVILAARRDLAAAVRDFDKALALSPRLSAVLVERGRVRLAQDQPQEALTDFRAALEAGAEGASIRVEMARAHLAMEDRAAARAILDESLAIQPDFAPALELRNRLGQ